MANIKIRVSTEDAQTQIKKLATEFTRLGLSSEQTEKQVAKLQGKLIDKMGADGDKAALARVSESLGHAEKEARKFQDSLFPPSSFDKMKRFGTDMKARWIGISMAVAGAAITINQAFRLMEQGATAIMAEKTFESMAVSMKFSADKIIGDLKRVTQGAIDESDLMQKAIKGIAQGILPEDLSKIGEMARSAAQTQGMAVGQAWESILDSIANQTPKSLKKFGLLGKEGLSIINEAIRLGRDDVNMLKLAYAAFEVQQARMVTKNDEITLSLQRGQAAWKELKEQIGKFLNLFIILYGEVSKWEKESKGKIPILVRWFGSPEDMKAAQEILDLMNKKNVEAISKAPKSPEQALADQKELHRKEMEKNNLLKDRETEVSRFAQTKMRYDNELALYQKNVSLKGQLSDIGYQAGLISEEQFLRKKLKMEQDATNKSVEMIKKEMASAAASFDKRISLTPHGEDDEKWKPEIDKLKVEKATALLALQGKLDQARVDVKMKLNEADLLNVVIAQKDLAAQKEILSMRLEIATSASNWAEELKIKKQIFEIDEKIGLLQPGLNEERSKVVGDLKREKDIRADNLKLLADLGRKQSALDISFGTAKKSGNLLEQLSLEEQIFAVKKQQIEINTQLDAQQKAAQLADLEWEQKNSSTLKDYYSMQADFYKDLIGFEEEYRQAQLDYIEEVRAANAELFGEEVANAKAKQSIGELDQQMFEQKSDQVSTALGQMASAFQSIGSMYDKNSAEYARMQEAAKAMIVLQQMVAVANAVAAIANQGLGDPYTAFARIAAMVAAMGSLLASTGIAFGGGGAVTSTPNYAFSDTVLGGAAGVGSESIQKSWELLEDTYDMQYTKLSGIYNEMKDLNDNITGLVTSIIRTGGVGGMGVNLKSELGAVRDLENQLFTPIRKIADLSYLTDALGISQYNVLHMATNWITNTIGGLVSSIFGGGIERIQYAGGIQTGGSSIANLLAGGGMGSQQYASIEEKKEGGWFSSSTYSYYTLYQALDKNVSDMMDKVFKNMGQTIVFLAEGLGTDVNAAMSYIFSGRQINLKGMGSEAISKALNEYFSSVGDIAVSALFGPLLRQYQRLNEGLMETATRILIDKAVVMETLNMTNQIFTGTIPQIIQLSEALITMAGGLDKLTESAATYYDKFFSDAEKQVRLAKQLSDNLGLIPGSRADYRKAVEALNLSNEADQKRYILMLQLAEAADTYYSSVEDAAKEAADAAKKLTESLKSLSKTIADWLSNLNLSNLAPVQSAAGWTSQYTSAMSKASMITATPDEISEYLSYATKYLEFQKSYGTTGNYQMIYDAVVADVIRIQNQTLTRHASGGLTQGLSFAGEIGPEWVVPTYEPQRSRFLKDVGSDPETLGKAIAKHLRSSNGGSTGEAIIHNHIYIDGKEIQYVVSKGMRTNPDLIQSTRRAVN